MDLEPKTLRAFLAIYAGPTISAAAAALGVTQPTMSGHLRRLRSHFDDPLFEYRSGRLHHTSKARELHGEIAMLVAGLDRLAGLAASWSAASSNQRFRLQASAYVQDLFAAALDARLRSAGPGISLDIVTFEAGQETACDLAIGPREIFRTGMKMKVIFSERLVCLFDPALSEDGQLSLDRFCRLDHLLVGPAPSPAHDAVDTALAAIGRARHVARILPSEANVASMVREGDRLALLPERSAHRHAGGLAVAPVPLQLAPIRFAMAWPLVRTNDAPNIWLRRQVEAVVREADGRSQSASPIRPSR